MSTSDLYLLYGKKVRHWSEHRNGWGSAPVVWDYLANKYLTPTVSGSFGREKEVWKLGRSDGLSDAELAALFFTFDWAYAPKNSLGQIADWFNEFSALVASTQYAGVNHWDAFAEELRNVDRSKKDYRLFGVCVACTSVSDMWAYATPDNFASAWPISKED